MVLKTASALKNKYSAIVSLKKIETTPEKSKKRDNEIKQRHKEIISVLARDRKEPNSTAVEINVVEESNELHTISKEKEAEDDQSETSAEKEAETAFTKNVETVSPITKTKEKFIKSDIVDKLASKIQAINDIDNEELNESANVPNTNESGEKTDNVDAKTIESISSEVPEKTENQETEVSSAKQDEGLETKQQVQNAEQHSDKSEQVLTSIKEKDSNEKEENEKDENLEKSDTAKDTLEQTNKTELEKEGASDNITESPESKEEYKKKLESTILSCKAKLGITEEDSLSESSEEDSDDSDGEESDSESDDEDEDDQNENLTEKDSEVPKHSGDIDEKTIDQNSELEKEITADSTEGASIDSDSLDKECTTDKADLETKETAETDMEVETSSSIQSSVDNKLTDSKETEPDADSVSSVTAENKDSDQSEEVDSLVLETSSPSNKDPSDNKTNGDKGVCESELETTEELKESESVKEKEMECDKNTNNSNLATDPDTKDAAILEKEAIPKTITDSETKLLVSATETPDSVAKIPDSGRKECLTETKKTEKSDSEKISEPEATGSEVKKPDSGIQKSKEIESTVAGEDIVNEKSQVDSNSNESNKDTESKISSETENSNLKGKTNIPFLDTGMLMEVDEESDNDSEAGRLLIDLDADTSSPVLTPTKASHKIGEVKERKNSPLKKIKKNSPNMKTALKEKLLKSKPKSREVNNDDTSVSEGVDSSPEKKRKKVLKKKSLKECRASLQETLR